MMSIAADVVEDIDEDDDDDWYDAVKEDADDRLRDDITDVSAYRIMKREENALLESMHNSSCTASGGEEDSALERQAQRMYVRKKEFATIEAAVDSCAVSATQEMSTYKRRHNSDDDDDGDEDLFGSCCCARRCEPLSIDFVQRLDSYDTKKVSWQVLNVRRDHLTRRYLACRREFNAYFLVYTLMRAELTDECMTGCHVFGNLWRSSPAPVNGDSACVQAMYGYTYRFGEFTPNRRYVPYDYLIGVSVFRSWICNYSDIFTSRRTKLAYNSVLATWLSWPLSKHAKTRVEITPREVTRYRDVPAAPAYVFVLGARVRITRKRNQHLSRFVVPANTVLRVGDEYHKLSCNLIDPKSRAVVLTFRSLAVPPQHAKYAYCH